MTEAKILSGRDISQRIKTELKERVLKIRETVSDFQPFLAIVQVGDREDSNVYIRQKLIAAEECCMKAEHIKVSRQTTQTKLLCLIEKLNNDSSVHGIIVQLPLESDQKIDSNLVTNSIASIKDVDGLSENNAGKLAHGELADCVVPCTPRGCLQLIRESGMSIQGSRCVVMGRSKIVGRPMADLLMWQHGTVTVLHSRTQDPASITRQADILVVAIGQPLMVKADWVKPGAVVIDCGISSIPDPSRKTGKRLVGDVDYEEVRHVAGYITPVPGGVGPMTVAMLLQNTVDSAHALLHWKSGGNWSLCVNPVVAQNPVPSDIEISRSRGIKPISKLAAEIGISPSEMELHGNTKAKVDLQILNRLHNSTNGKYVVITGINPTSFGEGKKYNYSRSESSHEQLSRQERVRMYPSAVSRSHIRHQGGAAGGGYSQVVPMDDFNLHLTGDIHAITAANNLMVAALDARMFHEATQTDTALLNRLLPLQKDGCRYPCPIQVKRIERLGLDPDNIDQWSELDTRRFVRLKIDPDTVQVQRVLDTNDRFLRKVTIGQSSTEKGHERQCQFDLSVASEVMAILALTTGLADMRDRMSRIMVAFDESGKPVTTSDLGVCGAMTVLMRDSIKPNLMQNLEGGPVFVHAGPFANIAHGNSSVLADQIALKLVGPDGYVLTEAGFGSDIGAEKFFNIKCRASGLVPNAAVLVVTVRALKMHGGGPELVPGHPLPPAYLEKNLDLVRIGCANMAHHIRNVGGYGVPVVVAVNQFSHDHQEELDIVCQLALDAGATSAVCADHWAQGGKGAEALAAAVVEACKLPVNFKYLYDAELTLLEKIKCIATRTYGASGIVLAPEMEHKLDQFEKLGFGRFPICMAKTPMSLSDNPQRRGVPTEFELPIRDIRASVGAGFVYPLVGTISTMPGLPTRPCFYDIDVDERGQVTGLF